MKWIGTLFIFLVIFSFAVGFSSRKIDLYKNMVNASVVIYTDNISHGSGVFMDNNIILTAAHVLEQSDICSIELNDGTILESSDLYVDDKEDVGFIFVDADELYISKMSQSRRTIGDIVYLVGSPYSVDFKFTITKGILSHLDRDIWGDRDWHDLLQTDAEGAPGSSGGPLYNSKGEVIGICVTGCDPGGGVTLCESAESILEAYKRCMELRDAVN